MSCYFHMADENDAVPSQTPQKHHHHHHHGTVHGDYPRHHHHHKGIVHYNEKAQSNDNVSGGNSGTLRPQEGSGPPFTHLADCPCQARVGLPLQHQRDSSALAEGGNSKSSPKPSRESLSFFYRNRREPVVQQRSPPLPEEERSSSSSAIASGTDAVGNAAFAVGEKLGEVKGALDNAASSVATGIADAMEGGSNTARNAVSPRSGSESGPNGAFSAKEKTSPTANALPRNRQRRKPSFFESLFSLSPASGAEASSPPTPPKLVTTVHRSDVEGGAGKKPSAGYVVPIVMIAAALLMGQRTGGGEDGGSTSVMDKMFGSAGAAVNKKGPNQKLRGRQGIMGGKKLMTLNTGEDHVDDLADLVAGMDGNSSFLLTETVCALAEALSECPSMRWCEMKRAFMVALKSLELVGPLVEFLRCAEKLAKLASMNSAYEHLDGLLHNILLRLRSRSYSEEEEDVLVGRVVASSADRSCPRTLLLNCHSFLPTLDLASGSARRSASLSLLNTLTTDAKYEKNVYCGDNISGSVVRLCQVANDTVTEATSVDELRYTSTLVCRALTTDVIPPVKPLLSVEEARSRLSLLCELRGRLWRLDHQVPEQLADKALKIATAICEDENPTTLKERASFTKACYAFVYVTLPLLPLRQELALRAAESASKTGELSQAKEFRAAAEENS